MPVNRKALIAFALLAAGLASLLSCTSSSTTISGQLSTITFTGTGSEEEVAHPLPIGPIRVPERYLSDISIGRLPDRHQPEAEFIPDEILVRYKPGVEPLGVRAVTLTGGFDEMRTRHDVANGAVSLLKLEPAESVSMTKQALMDRTLREIERLNALSYVEHAQPNYLYSTMADPADELYGLQWHYPLINWDLIWDDASITNLDDVIVAVIDTGIVRKFGTKGSSNHEDFGGGDLASSPFVYEYDTISDAGRARDGNGYDNDATDPGDNPNPALSSFHGTHVIGTIGAYVNNGTTGVAGMAGRSAAGSSVKIMPLRALGSGGIGTTADIVTAILYAAKLPNSTNQLPAQKADVINLSLGSKVDDSMLESAVNAAYGEDIVIVAAAGNDGTPAAFYPAAYDNVISVSAVDIGAEITTYSNYGNTIDVAAPGGSFSFDLNFDDYVDGVLSTFTRYNDNGTSSTSDDFYETGSYAFSQGTSMAAPHVAAVAAMLKATDPSPSASDIKNRIQSRAIDLGTAGRDDFYGHGLIDAHAAVKNGAGLIPVVFPFPKQFKLKGDNPSDSFTLRNIGDGTAFSYTSIDIEPASAQSWLTASPTSAGAATQHSIDISVDTSSNPTLKNGGTYTARLTVHWGTEEEHVYVLYNVNGFPKPGMADLGKVYVVALDVSTGDIDSLDTTYFSSYYNYRMSAVPSGEYLVAASTDRDGDLVIFEEDDAYGMYLSLDQIETVKIGAGENIQNIDFDVIDQINLNQ
jgi:serine protease